MQLGSKIGSNQVIRSFAMAPINLSRSCINQFSVQIEGVEKPRLVGSHIGFDPLQCIISHKKGRFHRAVVAPKAHGAARRIIEAALIWETKRHSSDPVRKPLGGLEDQW